MKTAVIKLMDGISAVNRSLVWVLGIVITFNTVLLTYDVLMRYIFSSPTSWAFGLATWGTGLIGFSLGGYAMLTNQHVRIDFFYEKYSKRFRAIVDIIGILLLWLVVAAFVYLGTDYVTHYYNIGAKMPGGFPLPLWLSWLIVPVGGILIGLQSIVNMINYITILITGEEFHTVTTGDEEE